MEGFLEKEPLGKDSAYLLSKECQDALPGLCFCFFGAKSLVSNDDLSVFP